jgi:hypothetical protein
MSMVDTLSSHLATNIIQVLSNVSPNGVIRKNKRKKDTYASSPETMNIKVNQLELTRNDG